MYYVILTTVTVGNAWQPVLRISASIHFPSNIRGLFGWSVVGICIAVGLSATRGAHQKHFTEHFFTEPRGLVRSRYVSVTNGELKKTKTVSGTGRSLNKILMSRAIAVHVRYNSSIVRFIAAFCKTI